MDFYQELKERFSILVCQDEIWSTMVNIVHVRPLTSEEVIGKPDRDDYPLLKGREVMIQANFKGCLGQAFTDMPGNYKGTLRDIFQLPLKNNFQRAVLISSINAVLRYLKYIKNTVHCKDSEPAECANRFKEYILEQFDNPKIAFIGLQPAIVESLATIFKIRVVDLDKDNVGIRKNNILIEDVSHTAEILSWADIIIATGTTAVNNTLISLLNEKPILFYGVTISGIAYLMGYQQICFCGH